LPFIVSLITDTDVPAVVSVASNAAEKATARSLVPSCGQRHFQNH
jgi:hypothetical protein